MTTRFSLAALAVLLAACSQCYDQGYKRRFDLASHCKDSGACQMPAGVLIYDGGRGDDMFSTGSFELAPDQVVTVPVDPFRSELARKPVLVATLSAGAPLDSGAGQVLFDGKIASCAVDRTGLTTQFTLTCEVPAYVAAMSFDYAGAGLSDGQGYAAFDLSLYLEEASPSGSERVCAE